MLTASGSIKELGGVLFLSPPQMLDNWTENTHGELRVDLQNILDRLYLHVEYIGQLTHMVKDRMQGIRL